MIPVCGTTCEIFGKYEGLVKCDGCGHCTTKAFCKKYIDHPEINIWKGMP